MSRQKQNNDKLFSNCGCAARLRGLNTIFYYSPTPRLRMGLQHIALCEG